MIFENCWTPQYLERFTGKVHSIAADNGVFRLPNKHIFVKNYKK